MGEGRGVLEETAESRGVKFLGLSLKQTVVIAVVTYAAITALLIGNNFSKGEKTIVVTTHNQHLLINYHGQDSNSALTDADVEFSEQDLVESGTSGTNGEKVRIINSVTDDDVASSSIENQDDLYYELRSSLYHSSVVFELNYEEMMSKFKIFIYPGDDHSFKVLSGTAPFEELRYTDDLFVYHLYQSDFVTLDPEKADLLVLPVSIRGVMDYAPIGPQKIGKFLNKYIQSIRDDYPYWSRTLGADHVVVTCHDAKEDGSRNVLELKKNAIQLACTPLAGNGSQTFYPHKDVAMPLYQNTPLPTTDGDVERSTLAYYNGPSDPESLYASLGVSLKEDSNFAFEARDVEPAVHYKRLTTSKFCLILGPQDYGNIVNALRFGCVPVIVSDGKLYDLPFQDILNWSQFSIIVSPKNVKKVKSLLSKLDEQHYITMQYLAKEASKHMEWHTPPQEQDAFYMVLYDLWVRRHAIRYTKREDL